MRAGATGEGRRGRGFTLVEVLVALTIMALVVGVLFQIFGGGMRAVGASGDYTRAVLLAQSKLEELSAVEVAAGDEQSGEFDQRYRWGVQVQPYEGELPGGSVPVVPLRARVRVSWDAGPVERSVELNTILLSSGR